MLIVIQLSGKKATSEMSNYPFKNTRTHFKRCSLFAGTHDCSQIIFSTMFDTDSIWMRLEQHQHGNKALLTAGIICKMSVRYRQGTLMDLSV